MLSLITSKTIPSYPAVPHLTLSICLLSWETVFPRLWLQTRWVMPWSEKSRNQFLKGPFQSLPWIFRPLQGEVPLPKWNKLVQTISSAGPPLVGGREGAVGTALDTKQPATLWLLPPAPRWPPPPPPCLHAPSLPLSLSFFPLTPRCRKADLGNRRSTEAAEEEGAIQCCFFASETGRKRGNEGVSWLLPGLRKNT